MRSGQVDGWPVVVEAQMRPRRPPETIRVRAGVRRGRIPDALRTLLFWPTAGIAAASGTHGRCPR